MASPPLFPPPSSPPPPPPPRRTRQATRLVGLTARHMTGEKLSVSIDPHTGKVTGPHHTQFRSYLGTLARDKVFIISYVYFKLCLYVSYVYI